MTTEEKIRRIEQAPKEVQTMVAKAFLREDIPDDEIQYLFNTMPLEEMNDPEVIIENVNAEQPEGIGATGFTIRNSKPYDNKQYITRGSGGWSNCIKGNPMDAHANVLANCVGYASGRFNEIIELARDFHECRYTNLRCNACDFIERAQEASLEVGMEPRVGAIMCWGGGPGGCGHVEVVEIWDTNLHEMQTSASDYGGSQFYNAMRKNDNGRWGLSSSFYFRGFIYQPKDVQEWIEGKPKEEVTPDVPRDENKDQIKVLVDDLNVRACGSTNGDKIGVAKEGKYYDYYEVIKNQGYTWYRITNDGRSQWVADDGTWLKVYPKKKEEYVSLKVLDTKDDYVLVDLGKTWIKKETH